VTEYVVPSETVPDRELREGVERALATARTEANRTRRARQFETSFSDPVTASWVLDLDGTVRRANDRARELCGDPSAKLDGHSFWELRLWENERDADRIRDGFDDALRGSPRTLEIACETAGSESIVDLSLRAVPDESGTARTVLATTIDVTERARLERDLRQSERLHRVVLNNMTETVLLTDENGAFTYICPNVRFIFGYTVEEIREMGTVEELLGEDPFDPDVLEERGVIANVERTAVDKAGEEHTLLINAKRVSIEEGTTLISCRDITARKGRERALSTLHDLARELLYTETDADIARTLVEHTTRVLALDPVACYLFDADANVLRPEAKTDALQSLHGPLDPVAPDADSVVSRALLEGTPITTAPSTDSSAEGHELDRASELESAIAVPLGDSGVLFAGVTDAEALDELTEEVVDLIAATAEAAFDRVRRERDLRERDRELRRRNRRLARLNRINDVIREIDGALVGADTREGIEYAVCERLTRDDRFSFAWIGTLDEDSEEITPQAWAGEREDYLNSTPLAIDTTEPEPTVQAVNTHELTVVSNVADGLREAEWRPEALSHGYRSVLSLPLVHDESFYGVLSVYASQQGVFDETTQTVLSELGETIGAAITAIKQRDALLSDTVTQLEYETTDEEAPLLRLARAADCAIDLDEGIQQTADSVVAFATIHDGSVKYLQRAAASIVGIDDLRAVTDPDSEGSPTVQLRLPRSFVATRLVEEGAVLRELSVTPARMRLEIEVPRPVAVRTIDDVLTAVYPDATLRSQHERRRSVTTTDRIRSQVVDRLTDRQLEVARTAYHSGFFESPRRSTGEDVAATLGISPSAFYQLNRTVQRKLFATLFERSSVA
jgi:PAS domain S-box-containing protein